MYSFGLVVLAVVSQVAVGLAAPVDDVTQGTELLLAFMTHRHGDRTPTDEDSATTYSTNPEALITATKPYGYGQLTKQGKQRAYRLGQFIRRRYDDFIAVQYNSSEIYLQSTDITRSKMTILTVLSAIFPPTPENAWSDLIHWNPVPYTTNNEEVDPNMPLENCSPYSEYYFSTLNSTGPYPTMAKYNDILTETSSILNLSYDLKDYPIMIYEVYDVLRSQINLGIPIPEELEKILPGIIDAAGEAVRIQFADLDKSALMSGVLLHDFVEFAESAINGDDTPIIRIYSAHDVNVYALESITKLTPKQGVPKFTPLLSLELRKDSSGNIFVLPVYLPTPEQPEIYLQVEGCDSILCSWDQFKNITSKYAIDLDTWRSECNWTLS